MIYGWTLKNVVCLVTWHLLPFYGICAGHFLYVKYMLLDLCFLHWNTLKTFNGNILWLNFCLQTKDTYVTIK